MRPTKAYQEEHVSSLLCHARGSTGKARPAWGVQKVRRRTLTLDSRSFMAPNGAPG